MILRQNQETGFWVDTDNPHVHLVTHSPDACEGRLCDVHDRRGPDPWASWPLNWREDRAIMEVICPCGVGHPTIAQAQYWRTVFAAPWLFLAAVSHGCCGLHCPTSEAGE